MPGPPGQGITKNADPSVIRVGSTYHSVESDGNNIYARSASSPAGLGKAERRLIWSSPKNMPNVWAPELVKLKGALDTNIYAVYFASGDGKQPRESWEKVAGNPFVNEAPQPIKDPSGQLHIAYSANGSWSDQYCLADLRLKKDGDPTNVWNWYKSNGCLFGSNRDSMMDGWDPTLYANGPGSHSFVLVDGDIDTSPPAGPKFPLMFHAVRKGTPYSWGNRMWHTGTFTWWGDTTYSRANVPGANTDKGWSLKFFE
ncbi:hydrolase [Streptomyces sp. NL15-2K]|uniref:hydrolase n=1 Tax=Streptomyces sp. NL15-2K TaxID=376149 RepID=UPI00209BE670|nr:hydrolase [Streptomyces sp. NL15-2K]